MAVGELQLSTTLGAAGLTPKAVEALGTLGLTTVGGLLAHLPLRHERLEAEAPIDALVAGQIGSARGEVTATRPVRGGGKPRFEVVVMDETGRLDLVWFNQMYRARQIHPGMRVRVQGKVNSRGPGIQMVNPTIEILDEAGTEPEANDARVRPVYPANEMANSAAISRAVGRVLERALPRIEDHLGGAFREERRLPALAEAYRMQHAPASLEEAVQSRRRLAYDELLMLQLGVHMRRAHLRGRMRSPALRHDAAIDRRIRERFAFTLTPGQEGVVADLVKDLTGSVPTNRLIQGDVGSGKTLVALYAMLMAVASGHQASLMAPTELLSEQHFASISRVLEGSKVRVELLTGGTPKGERESILARLAAGEVDLLIGTHALLTESVRFASLAVAVIDEQHRFGVSQRATLRAKASDGESTPHVVVMTATPIPRTLAITLFGDLDVSTIRGLPPGRKPIQTRVIDGAHRADAYAEVARRVGLGQQAYIVAPAIEPGERGDDAEDPGSGGGLLRDVRTVARELEDFHLPGRRVAILHGRLARATREAVMERFRSGTIDVLVATTVIEVGVDVPNATAMVVEQADRFGLAQLHQLRGRVGRGAADSCCLLIADAGTPEAAERLATMAAVSDGFVLAEKDLEIRGPGEMFGLRQSGLPPFKVADLVRDRDLLAMARRDAAAWIERSPELGLPEEALRRRRLLRRFGAHLGLGDVG